jgi:hypothetical protein
VGGYGAPGAEDGAGTDATDGHTNGPGGNKPIAGIAYVDLTGFNRSMIGTTS